MTFNPRKIRAVRPLTPNPSPARGEGRMSCARLGMCGEWFDTIGAVATAADGSARWLEGCLNDAKDPR